MSAPDDIVETLRLAPGRSVYVRADGRFGLRRDPLGSGPADHGAAGAVAPAVARGLLGGAILCGRADGLQSGQPQVHHPLSLPQHVWSLCAAYVSTHSSPDILRRGAERLRQRGRTDMADYLDQKAREETGHDRLALRDLAALGLPAEALVAAISPAKGHELVAYARACVEGDEPLAMLGYTYALERPTLAIGQAQVDAVQALCPPGIDATRCMRVHSAIGSDAEHVRELVERIAGLPFVDRRPIARATYETTRRMWRLAAGEQPSDADILDLLKAAVGRLPAHFEAKAVA